MERLNKNKWSFTKVIGANHRSASTWKLVDEGLKRKLLVWKGKHLSFGGRVTLINSVLASLPLYFSHFSKQQGSYKRIGSNLRRRFLWSGGVEYGKFVG